MPRAIGPIRLAFADDEAGVGEETRVLLRQRVGWVALLGAFLALLCLPAHRGMLEDHWQGVVAHRAPEWEQVGASNSASRSRPVQRVLAENPEDRDLQLGGIAMGSWRSSPDDPDQQRELLQLKSASLDALRRLMERHPDDPVVVAALIRYCTRKAVRLHRPDDGAEPEARPVPAPVLAEYEEYCRRGARLDPDNGFFPTMRAVARFEARDDEQALELLHEASLLPRWNDYALAEGAGAQALLLKAYGDRGPVLHAGPTAGVILPHLSQVRAMARIAARHAEDCLARGELTRGHALHVDQIRLGRQMRQGSGHLIGRLVGGAVQAINLRVRPTPEPQYASDAERKAARRKQREAYASRVAREAPAYAAEVERANREYEVLEAKQSQLSENGALQVWDQLLVRIVWREILGLSLAANLGVCLLLWGVASLLKSLVWSREGSQRRLLGWIWREAHPLIRVPAFAVPLLAASLAVAWAAEGALPGYLLLPVCVLPFFLRVTSRGDWQPVRARRLALAAAMAAALMAGLTQPWALDPLRTGWWKDVTASAALLGEPDPPTEIVNPTLAYLLPSGALLGLLIPAVVVCLTALRRGSFQEMTEGVRLLGKGSAGLLAVVYLGFILVAVPAGQRDGRAWDRSIEQEARGVPF